jgi:hypothetical protein
MPGIDRMKIDEPCTVVSTFSRSIPTAGASATCPILVQETGDVAL